MIPELGHFALILALCLAGLQCVLPCAGIFKKNQAWMQTARSLVLGQCFFITLSFLCLGYAFVQDDFSVAYVAQSSNASLPWIYKISGIWSGHEGSLLLWVFLLSVWMLAVSLDSRRLPLIFSTRVLVVLGMIAFGFLLFLWATSNPFARFLPLSPIDGRDLNPILQDPGLIFHPPVLYMGYVGFSVPFAFAVSALWGARTEELPWAKWMRSWVLAAFGFLTIGIALGSWWAYYELGWGGWWFWDPVENASFMPWIVGIALIHSLMVSDKRGIFQSWTILLSIIAFALSLLGTFLVRSGILTSVHAFANDPKRGVFLLGFLLLVIGGALALYAVRAGLLPPRGARGRNDDAKIELFSRETAILVSTVFLLVGCATVLLGTLFPLIYDAFTGQKLSVGFPYFNAVFIPLIIPVLVLIPLGPLSKWGHNACRDILKKIKIEFIVSLVLAMLLPWIFAKTVSMGVVLGLGLGIWIGLGTFKSAFDKIRQKGFWGLSKGAWGMISAHGGMAILVIGVTLVSYYHVERDLRIKPHQVLEIADYQILFQSIEPIEGSNYIGSRGYFLVSKQGKQVADLRPEKRTFVAQGIKMTETAIDPGMFRDIYISLGDPLGGGSWSVRIYYKPFVRWIWAGGLLIALGSFLGAWGRRK